MINEKLFFSKNWNNKLNCDYFTTFRLSNSNKFKVQNVFNVFLKTKSGIVEFKPARLLISEQCLLTDVDDLFCYVDTGLCRNEFIPMILKLYKISNYQVSQLLFTKLLFEKVKDPLLF